MVQIVSRRLRDLGIKGKEAHVLKRRRILQA
jgi:hypothetical protein